MSKTTSMDPTTTRYTWTYDEYARLPDDGNRYEVIDGEVLVTPAPSTDHQHILLNLAFALRPWVEREGLGVVLPDVDIGRVKKPRRYRDFGVAEYWVVDPGERAVWVWRFAAGATDGERVEGMLTWTPEGAQTTLEIATEELFRPM